MLAVGMGYRLCRAAAVPLGGCVVWGKGPRHAVQEGGWLGESLRETHVTLKQPTAAGLGSRTSILPRLPWLVAIAQ